MEIEWNVPDETGSSSREGSSGSSKISSDSDQQSESLEMLWDADDTPSDTQGSQEVRKIPSGERVPQYKTADVSAGSVYTKRVRDSFRIIDKNRESTGDPAILCGLCLEQVMASLEAERGFILLFESHKKEMQVYAASNIDPKKLLISEPVSHSILNKVMADRKPIVITDAIDDPLFRNLTSVVISGLRSILCTPLIMSRGLLGILYIDNRLKKGAFTNSHLEYLNEFAQEITERINRHFPQIQPKIGK